MLSRLWRPFTWGRRKNDGIEVQDPSLTDQCRVIGDTFLKPASYYVTEKDNGSYIFRKFNINPRNIIVEIKEVNLTAPHGQQGIRDWESHPWFDQAV